MASEWFYSRDGHEHGPFSSGDLRSLAKRGDLLPTDYLWKEGMTAWRVAADFPTLFPPKEETASVILTPDENAQADAAATIQIDIGGKKSVETKSVRASPDPLASLKVDVATAGKKATQAVQAHAKTVGKVAALAAERTKISTLTLPMAYAALGDYCYRTRTHEKEFPELFANLDAIHASLAEDEKKPIASGGTIGEQAKAWAEQGMAFAKSRAQGVQAKTLLVQLGKSCFNKSGPQAGPEELVAKVRSLKNRLSAINSDVGTSVKKTGGARAWFMYGGGALLCLMILGVFIDRKDPSIPGGGSSSGRGKAALRPAAKDLPSDPELRDIYEDGWERGAKYGNEWLTAMRGHAKDTPLPTFAREHSWVHEKKEDVLARRISSIENIQMTMAGLIREDASPLVIKSMAAEIQDARGFHDGFKIVAEAGLRGKDTSNATTKKTDTTTLTVAEARRLIQRDNWLTIKNPTVISDEVAKVLAQFPLGLDLVGVTTLSDSTIEILAQKPAGHLRLGGLKSLSDKAAKSLSQNRSPVMVLDSVPAISDKAAALLAQHPGSLLSLGGLTKLSAQAAKALASYEGDLHLDGLTALTPEVAKILAQHRGGLSLKGVATLSSEVAENLAQHKGALYLDGLKTLSRDAAKPFATHWGALSFNGLATLTPEVAEPLVQAEGELALNGIAVPSLEVAEVLARHQSRLYLEGLKVNELPDEVKKALRRHRRIELPDNLLSL